jgi:hypothetical protein
VASLASSAYGTKFYIGASLIPELVSLDGLGSAADTVDTSAMDGDGYSSEVTTIKRNSPITMICNYVPGNAIQESLKTQYDNSTQTAYSVVLSGTSPSTWSFNARVSRWQMQPLGVNTAQQLSVIFNPVGVITISGGA